MTTPIIHHFHLNVVLIPRGDSTIDVSHVRDAFEKAPGFYELTLSVRNAIDGLEEAVLFSVRYSTIENNDVSDPVDHITTRIMDILNAFGIESDIQVDVHDESSTGTGFVRDGRKEIDSEEAPEPHGERLLDSVASLRSAIHAVYNQIAETGRGEMTFNLWAHDIIGPVYTRDDEETEEETFSGTSRNGVLRNMAAALLIFFLGVLGDAEQDGVSVTLDDEDASDWAPDSSVFTKPVTLVLKAASRTPPRDAKDLPS